MKMIKKQFLFVGIDDISSIPSGKKNRRDCTDFRLNYEVMNEIKKLDVLCIVLLAADEGKYLWATEDEYQWMFEVIGYALSSFIGCAVLKAIDEDIEPSLIKGMGLLGRNEILSNKDKWLILNHKELADKYEIACLEWK